MTEAEVVAECANEVERAISAFRDSLHVIPKLSGDEREALTRAAGHLVKHCMGAQSDMNIALVRMAFDR